MNTRNLLILISMMTVTLVGQESLMPSSDVLGDYDIKNVQYAQLFEEDEQGEAFFQEQDYLSTKRAFLYSFFVPGAGQIYTKKPVRGALFIAAEAGLWLGYAILQSKGVELRDDYEAFHDEHFDVYEYLEWYEVVTDSFREEKGIEHLPHHGDNWYDVDKNHDYYEMTGKYPWFLLGWEDAPDELYDRALHPDLWDYNQSTQDLNGILIDWFDSTQVRQDYMAMRKEANDNFIWAKYMIGAAIFNHLVSAFDAAWSAHSHNQERNKGFSEAIHMESGIARHKPTGAKYPELKLAIRLR